MKKISLLFYFCLISSFVTYVQAYKILFVTGAFPPYSGTAVLNQITGLIDRGHDIYIYSQRKRFLECVNPDIIKYRLYDRAYYNSKSGRNTGEIHNLPPDLYTFDIVFVQHGNRSAEFLQVFEKKIVKAKLVTCFRGIDISRYVKQNLHVYDKLLQRGDLFLPVCDYFRECLIQLGADPDKVIVNYSGIDISKFSFNPRSFNPNDSIQCISVCRLTEKKGLKYAIQAVAMLVKFYPNLFYTIVGAGGLEQELKRLIRKLKVNKHIKFKRLIRKLEVNKDIELVGRVSNDQVVRLLEKAHIFILPSVTAENGDQEGIPNAVKEAMASGLVVVSTYHSGIPELIEDGISGLLVPERDVGRLAQAIKYIIDHSELWPEMAIAGRKIIESEYDKEKVNDRMVVIFDELMA